MPILPENWETVKALFEAALDQGADRRSSFLDEHCLDRDVRAEVERLLSEHDQAGSFLSAPACNDFFEGTTPSASVLGNSFTATPRPQRLSNGEVLAGRFRIIRFIARGGMGEVYEAEDLELHENIAIKTVLPSIASNPGAIEQFKREIQLARKVTHANVCRIFDLVYDPRPSGSITFLTMEMLDGITLAAYLEKVGIVPLDEAIVLARQMAEGLDAAHRAGIIHQDFKTGNVMLINADDLEHRRVVITDFGLAYNSRAAGGTAGQRGGTPAYMAPEQIEGQPLSDATDIYAFGVVLYELVTGRLPYGAKTPDELLTKKCSQSPILPSRYAPDLPLRVERTILRCLAKPPFERFATARDVMAELDPPRSRWQWLTAASLVLVALGSIGGYEWRRAHLISADPTVAVVGFRNDTGDSNYDWLATQLSESLTADMGGSKGIRSVPTDEVASVKTELSVGQNQSLEHEDLSSVREALGANYLLLGSYAVDKSAQEQTLNVDIRLQDSHGNTAAEVHEDGNETDYPKLVASAASQIRDKLGAARLSDTQAEELQNIYPANPQSSRLYFQALDKLRSFDPPSALTLLQKAIDLDPENVAIHWGLADAWAQLRHDPEAAKAAELAANLAQGGSLPQEYVVLSQARAAEMNKQWDSAIEGFKALFLLSPQHLTYGLRLASAQIDGSRSSDALVTLASLAKLPPPMGTDPRIEMTKATAYGVMNDFNSQLQSAQLALAEARKRNGRMMTARAQLQLCWAHRNLGHVQEAFNACTEAQGLFSAFGDNVSAAVALNDLATWLSDRGHYAEAKQLYDRVIQVNQAAGAQKDYAGACVNAAKTLIQMSKSEDAEDYLNRALQAAGPIADKSDEALARTWLGEIRFEQGRIPEAQKEVTRALNLARELKDKSNEASALSNLALYQSETDSHAALATYQRVLSLRQELGEQAAVANCLHNMADVMYRSGDLQAAERQFREVITLRIQLKENGGLASAWVSLAQIDLERKNLASAQDLAMKALHEFHDEQDSDSESVAASVLVKVLVAAKTPEQAATYVNRIQEIASKDRDTAFENRLSIADYLDAIGHRDDAIRQLQALPSDAISSGRVFASLEGRLALVKLQAGLRPPVELRKELSSIKADANRAGFRLLAEKTAHLRS